MKKYWILISGISILFIILNFKSERSSVPIKNNFKKLSDHIQNKKSRINKVSKKSENYVFKNEKELEYFLTSNLNVKLNEKVKMYEKDLKKLSPCDFLKRYQHIKDRENLMIAIGKLYQQNEESPLRLLYDRDIGYYRVQYMLHSNQVNNSADFLDIPLPYKDIEQFDIKDEKIQDKLKEITDEHEKSILDMIQQNLYDELRYDEDSDSIELRNKSIYAFLKAYPKREKLEFSDDTFAFYLSSAFQERAEADLKTFSVFSRLSDFEAIANTPTEKAATMLLLDDLPKVKFEYLLVAKSLFRGSDLEKNFNLWVEDLALKYVEAPSVRYLDFDHFKVLKILAPNVLGEMTYEELIRDKYDIFYDNTYGDGCDDRYFQNKSED